MKDFRAAFRRMLCECILRPQELRDRRRRELVTLTGLNNTRMNYIKNHHLNANSLDRELTLSSYPNSTLGTPVHSPNASLAVSVARASVQKHRSSAHFT